MEQAVSATRMFIKAHRLNPPNKLPCSKAQSEGGEGCLQQRNGLNLHWDQFERDNASLSLIPGRHLQGEPDLPVRPYEANL